MRKFLWIALLLVCFSPNVAGSMPDRLFQEASAPRTLLFAGAINDENGKPVTGAVSVTFKLYASETGNDVLWSEAQTVVVAEDGTYQASLGENTSGGLTSDFSPKNGSRWLGIQAEGHPEKRVLLMNGEPAQKDPDGSGASFSPRVVRFSGVLRDNQGKPLTGNVRVNFRLFNDSEGGPPIWGESQVVEPGQRGVYTVFLGSKSDKGFPEHLLIGGEPRWVGVQPAGYAETRVAIDGANVSTASVEDAPSENSKCMFFGGALTEDGTPIEGSLSVNFGLYDDETGGNLLWSETQIVELHENGSYQVMLGAKSRKGFPEPLIQQGETRWLGIQPYGRTETRIVMTFPSELSNCSQIERSSDSSK